MQTNSQDKIIKELENPYCSSSNLNICALSVYSAYNIKIHFHTKGHREYSAKNVHLYSSE